MRNLLIALACLSLAVPTAAAAQARGGFGPRLAYGRGWLLARPQRRGYAPPPQIDFARPGAWWADQQYLARSGVRRGQLTRLDSVLERLARRAPGRQLDTSLGYQGERPVYRVRWITVDGRRVDYVVDGATGAILSER